MLTHFSNPHRLPYEWRLVLHFRFSVLRVRCFRVHRLTSVSWRDAQQSINSVSDSDSVCVLHVSYWVTVWLSHWLLVFSFLSGKLFLAEGHTFLYFYVLFKTKKLDVKIWEKNSCGVIIKKYFLNLTSHLFKN